MNFDYFIVIRQSCTYLPKETTHQTETCCSVYNSFHVFLSLSFSASVGNISVPTRNPQVFLGSLGVWFAP